MHAAKGGLILQNARTILYCKTLGPHRTVYCTAFGPLCTIQIQDHWIICKIRTIVNCTDSGLLCMVQPQVLCILSDSRLLYCILYILRIIVYGTALGPLYTGRPQDHCSLSRLRTNLYCTDSGHIVYVPLKCTSESTMVPAQCNILYYDRTLDAELIDTVCINDTLSRTAKHIYERILSHEL